MWIFLEHNHKIRPKKKTRKDYLSLSLFKYLNFGHTKQRFGYIPFGTLLTVINFLLSFVVIT